VQQALKNGLKAMEEGRSAIIDVAIKDFQRPS
jgi:hypothetical protein